MLRAAPLVPGGPAYQYKRGQILKLCSSWQLKHVADLDASLLFFTSSGRFLEACTFTHTVAYGGAAMHLSDNVSGVILLPLLSEKTLRISQKRSCT